MPLRWTDRRSVKEATPRDDIVISVVKWSRMWGWSIQRNGDTPFLARGTADTARQAKQAAEAAWADIAQGSGIVLPSTAFERRLSAERLINLQRLPPLKESG